MHRLRLPLARPLPPRQPRRPRGRPRPGPALLDRRPAAIDIGRNPAHKPPSLASRRFRGYSRFVEALRRCVLLSGTSQTMQSRDRRMLRRARCLAAAVALTAVLLGAATSARAEVLVDGTGEPTFTKTTTNSWFFKWNRVTGTDSQYFICFRLRKDGTVIEDYNAQNGPGSTNCSGNLGASGATGAIGPDAIHIPMTVGSIYEMCATDFRWQAVLYTSLSSACQSTIIDNTKPGINTFVNGTDTYTRNPTINIHIDYADTIAWPFPANFGCFALGGGCTVDVSTQYLAGCSVPNVPLGNYTFSKNNSFDCQTTLAPGYARRRGRILRQGSRPGHPRQPEQATNQGGNASSANISDPQCGSVILDRTPPVARSRPAPRASRSVTSSTSVRSPATQRPGPPVSTPGYSVTTRRMAPARTRPTLTRRQGPTRSG